jgi:hypothetical protein
MVAPDEWDWAVVSSCARVSVSTEPEIVAKHFSSEEVPGEITTKNGTAAVEGQPVVAVNVADVSPADNEFVIVVCAAAPLYCLRVTAGI